VILAGDEKRAMALAGFWPMRGAGGIVHIVPRNSRGFANRGEPALCGARARLHQDGEMCAECMQKFVNEIEATAAQS